MIDNHQNEVEQLFIKTCNCLKVTGFNFRIIKRKGPINTKKSFTVGYTNLKTKVIALDIYTPKKRQPKSLNSILRVFAHEIAHHQKKPYRQYFKGKWINRSHYPAFYRQVNKNINKIKIDPRLSSYFK